MNAYRYILVTFLIICSSLNLFSQNNASKPKADDRQSDNAVWYNARRGDAAAMNQVGVWYYTGNKVPRDYSQAYEWWKRGALKQNVKAMANLGVCYQYGRGIERDSVEAIRLYLTAIERGQQDLFNQRIANTPASAFDDMLIGLCYERGVGTMRDPLKAAELYAAAADRGSVDGMATAGRVYLEAGDKNRALKYLDQSYKAQGDLRSGYLAAKTRIGSSAGSERIEAISSLRNIADAGYAPAQTLLGTLYQRGDGVAADSKQAIELFALSANNGDAEGMWQYGQMLKQAGAMNQALFWLAQAANAGYAKQYRQYYASLFPNDPYRLYVEGLQSYINEGATDKAIDKFKAASKDKNDDAKVMEMVVLADRTYPKNNASKAEKDLEKMADSNPMAAVALQYLRNSQGTGAPALIKYIDTAYCPKGLHTDSAYEAIAAVLNQ